MRAFLLVLVLVSCLGSCDKSAKNQPQPEEQGPIVEQGPIDFCGETFSVTATEVKCHDKTVSDVNALKALTNLKVLDLNATKVSSVSALSALTSLETLSLALAPVSDASALKALTNLKVLHLDNTQVSDVSALSSLANLKNLNIIGTKVSAEQVEALKKALPKLEIYGP